MKLIKSNKDDNLNSLCNELDKEIDLILDDYIINGVINRRLAISLMEGFKNVYVNYMNIIFDDGKISKEEKNIIILETFNSMLSDVIVVK